MFICNGLCYNSDKPDDYVIATGKMVSVREFIELCAKKLGWNKEQNGPAIIWEGSGIDEIGRRADTKDVIVRIDKRYFRPTEVDQLLGDSSKSKRKIKLGTQKISIYSYFRNDRRGYKRGKKRCLLK